MFQSRRHVFSIKTFWKHIYMIFITAIISLFKIRSWWIYMNIISQYLKICEAKQSFTFFATCVQSFTNFHMSFYANENNCHNFFLWIKIKMFTFIFLCENYFSQENEINFGISLCLLWKCLKTRLENHIHFTCVLKLPQTVTLKCM